MQLRKQFIRQRFLTLRSILNNCNFKSLFFIRKSAKLHTPIHNLPIIFFFVHALFIQHWNCLASWFNQRRCQLYSQSLLAYLYSYTYLIFSKNRSYLSCMFFIHLLYLVIFHHCIKEIVSIFYQNVIRSLLCSAHFSQSNKFQIFFFSLKN